MHRTGDVSKSYFESAHKRFVSKFDKNNDCCWNWRAGKDQYGYGMFYFNGRNVNAARMSLIFNGIPIASDKVVRHKCDNPCCVNPAHLVVGTQRENVRDSILRGRRIRNHHKIEVETARKIGEMLSLGKTIKEISRCLGVSKYIIADIRSGKTWVTAVSRNWLKGNRALSDNQVKQVVLLLQKCPELTSRQIADKIGVSVFSVDLVSCRGGYKDLIEHHFWQRPKGMRPKRRTFKSCGKLAS